MDAVAPVNPIVSMTGFGMARAEADGCTVSVEIRSVNHRARKVNVRSRPTLGPYEKQLRDQVGELLGRGSIDVYVNVSRTASATTSGVRQETARGTVASLRSLAASLNLEDTLTARDLLLIPGLFDDAAEEPISEGEYALVAQALEDALAQLLDMRRAEGASTVMSLFALVEPLESFAVQGRQLAPQVVDRQRERLQARLDELAPGGIRAADEQALEREVCFFADRTDVNEEMDRLESHLKQFSDLLTRGGEVGKRLEFLAQEFLREVNTTASKASDSVIAGLAVDAKLAVEKVKEQAANLE